MEDGLVTKIFEIPTQFFTYPAKFIAPVWAQGFECQSGLCGLCCLTQKPEGVPQNYNTQLDRAICGFYNIKHRLCRKYDKRPLECKMYPFLFGVEEGQILISASLECPATNTKKCIQTGVLLDVFEDPYVDRMVTSMNDCYEKAVLLPQIWNDAYHVWKTLANNVQDYFSHKTNFPFLSEVRLLIVETIADTLGLAAPKIPTYSVAKLVKHAAGLYIATRFESHPLCLVKVRGSKTAITLFDENLTELNDVRIKTPTKFLELEIDKGAQHLLNDYVSFLCNRPFLSLGAIIATTIEPRPVPISLSNTLAGSFMPIEAGATLIAFRDNLERIDRNTMREIISFSEASICSTFTRPDIAVRGV